ncbi:MAG: ABC transporter substrate-binding protein [Eubacteriales bacterium]
MLQNTKRDKTWGLLAAIMVIFLFASYTLIKQLSELNDVVEDVNQIEFLSSSTQRMVRLVLNDQGDQALLSYLEVETQKSLNAGSDDSLSVLSDEYFREMADVILYNWDVILELIYAEDLDNNTLLLAADNHFYQMTNLSDAVKEHSRKVNYGVTDTQYRIGLLLILLSIIIFNNFMRNRAELLDNREQAKLALIDTATGLYNRSKCHELFKATLNVGREKQHAVIVFDLNDLKKTNDFRGHRMGDELIKSFANLLKSSAEVHMIPPFIGRYGGDEFLVYYEDLKSEDDLHYFLKELASLTKDFNDNEKRFQISYAQGYKIAVGEENNTLSVRQLFDLADESMYEHKKSVKAAREEDMSEETPLVIDNPPEEMEEDFDSIQDYEKKNIDRHVEAQKKTSMMIGATLLATALFLCARVAINKANETYIGGNVIYLPIGDSLTLLENQTIGNPWNNGSISSMLVFRALFTPTTDFSDVSPDLASDYKILDNGLTYEITLKEDLFWSDGEPITMEDIIFSFEAFILCGNGNVNLSTAFNKIVGVQDFLDGKRDSLEGLEVNGNVLTIRLSSPHNTFVQMLAQFVPLPEHSLRDVDVTTLTSETEFFYNPVSSGMYMVDSMSEDYNLVLKKNPYYTEATSDVETIVFLWDYTHEQIDYYSTSNITQMVSYRAMQGMDEYNVDVHFYRYFVFNLAGGYQVKTVAELESEALLDGEEMIAEERTYPEDREPNYAIADVRVRQAIAHAIDRSQLLSDLYFDTGTLGGVTNEASAEIYEYNPSKAIALLAEANYDFDRVFTIAYYHSDPTTYIFLQQVKAYLEAVGLTVEIVKATTGNDFMYVQREFDMLLKGLSSFNTDDWYNEFLSTNGNMSALMGDKGEFDGLVDQLSSTTTQNSYQSTLSELSNLGQSLLYKLPLFTLNESVYIRESRLSVPDDMVFTNTRYRSDLRFDEWYIKKG